MTAKPPPAELIAFMDANPGKYKNAPEPDGYNETQAIIRSLLKRPLIANPVAQPQIPKPMDIDQLYAVLSTAEIAAIPETGFRAIGEAVRSGDRPAVKRWIGIALAKGYIAQAKLDQIVNAVDDTIADPTWQAQVKDKNDLQSNWPNLEIGLHRKYIHETVLERG